jgi:hypothetical protein
MRKKTIDGRWLPLLLAIVLVSAAGFLYWAQRDSDQEAAESASVADDAVDRARIAEDYIALITEECQSGTDVGKQLRKRGFCPQAEKITEQPPIQVIEGPEGEAGPVGAAGPMGARGLQGPPGVAGAPGQPGTPGEPGQDGEPGPVGSQGPPGADGAAGETGPQGPPGVDGKDGAAGERGPRGVSVTDVIAECVEGGPPPDDDVVRFTFTLSNGDSKVFDVPMACG